MLALVSPAKKLDFGDVVADLPHSQPKFLDESEKLIKSARSLSRAKLQNLMKLSDKLTDLNFERFKAFSTPFTEANARQAVLVFNGDTYVGLNAKTLTADDLAFAQDHLRILSGLYGVLRPLDLIQPYRLEMGRRLNNPRGADLYDFWGDDLADAIDEKVAADQEPVVINLASNEYFKAARPKYLKSRVITPVFKEVKNGEAKVLGMFAKQARGMMARHMITHRLERSEDLKKFTDGGYAWQAHLSNDNTWVFTRQR